VLPGVGITAGLRICIPMTYDEFHLGLVFNSFYLVSLVL